MVMSRIWTGMIFLSILCAAVTGQGEALGASAMEGAQAGISLAVSMAGAICLWTGVGALLSRIGITEFLSKCFSPLLHRTVSGYPEGQGPLSGSERQFLR